MEFRNYITGLLLFCLLLLPAFVAAQDNGNDNGNGNGNGADAVEEPVQEEAVHTDEGNIQAAEEVAPPRRTEPAEPTIEPSDNINIKKVEFRTGVIPFLIFWQNNMVFPEEEVPWHDNVRQYLGVNSDEFHRVGYARQNDVWIPIFFLRRFQMMSNSYNHIMVIKGRPHSIPVTKGMTVGTYGTEITNEGFEVFMPTIASVSRRQKAVDERDALDLAAFQLEQYGFQNIVWFADRTRIPGSVASGWSVD